MTILIGVIGKKGAGKSTFAHLLSRHTPVTIISLADPLKAALQAAFPHIDRECLYGSSELRELEFLPGVTVRSALQTLGTEWGRIHLGRNVWVNECIRRASDIRNGAVVIPDVRFENEMSAIREAGGYLVQLCRAWAGSTDPHASEAEMERCAERYAHYIIDNADITLRDFERHVLSVWASILRDEDREDRIDVRELQRAMLEDK